MKNLKKKYLQERKEEIIVATNTKMKIASCYSLNFLGLSPSIAAIFFSKSNSRESARATWPANLPPGTKFTITIIINNKQAKEWI